MKIFTLFDYVEKKQIKNIFILQEKYNFMDKTFFKFKCTLVV